MNAERRSSCLIQLALVTEKILNVCASGLAKCNNGAFGCLRARAGAVAARLRSFELSQEEIRSENVAGGSRKSKRINLDERKLGPCWPLPSTFAPSMFPLGLARRQHVCCPAPRVTTPMRRLREHDDEYGDGIWLARARVVPESKLIMLPSGQTVSHRDQGARLVKAVIRSLVSQLARERPFEMRVAGGQVSPRPRAPTTTTTTTMTTAFHFSSQHKLGRIRRMISN